MSKDRKLLQERINQLEKELINEQEKTNSSKQNYHDLLNNSFDLIALFDINGKVSFANKALRDTLELSDDCLEKNLKILDVIHPENRKEAIDFFDKAKTNLDFEEFKILLITQSKQNVYVTGKINKTNANEYQCIFYDITDKLKTEKIQKLFYNVSNLAADIDTFKDFYEAIFKELNASINTQHMNIVLYDKFKTNNIIYSKKTSNNRKKSISRVEKKLIEYTLNHNKPHILYKKEIIEICGADETKKIPNIYIASPINTANNLGLVYVIDYTPSKIFNEKDLVVLNFISRQISIAAERLLNINKLNTQVSILNSISSNRLHSIWAVNKNYELTYFNDNFKKITYILFGASIEEKTNILNALKGSHQDYLFWKDKYDRTLKGENIYFQFMNIGKYNNEIWSEVYMNPIVQANGEITEISCIRVDISAQKNNEKITRESEEKFRTIFESFQDIYFRVDNSGKLVMVSPSVTEILGYQVADVIGVEINKIFDDSEMITRVKKNLDLEKRLTNVEKEIKTVDGQSKTFLININYVKNGLEIEGVARNITQLKETNEELRKSKEMAEHSLQIKERFLANMSHEIRTPMNGVIGMIDLLANTTLDEEQSDYLETIEKSSKILLNILNDILDLSKIEAGKITLKKDPINFVSTIEKVYSLFSQQAESKNTHLYYYIDENVPPLILADETRLSQVMSNLISNAIKFSNKGNININVKKLNIINNECIIHVAVKDSGIGISEEDQKLLFKSFQQIHNSQTREFSGTGLGLAISKELVNSMGGNIGVNSKEGVGSTFWFTFRAKIIASLYDEINPQQIKNLPDFSKHQPKILLVDDNEINRKVGSSILNKIGCQVETTIDGHNAIKLIKQHKYDLVFMDIQMPHISGVEATKIIKATIKEHPPIIAMTAFSMTGDKEKFINEGFDDYISKPIQAKDFSEKLITWLNYPVKKIKPKERKKQTSNLVINLNTLNQLEKYGGKELVIESLNQFIEETKASIRLVNRLLYQRKFKEIQQEIHKLKGTSGTLGIEKIYHHACHMERNLNKPIFVGVERQISELKFLFDEFLKQSQNILNKTDDE